MLTVRSVFAKDADRGLLAEKISIIKSFICVTFSASAVAIFRSFVSWLRWNHVKPVTEISMKAVAAIGTQLRLIYLLERYRRVPFLARTGRFFWHRLMSSRK